ETRQIRIFASHLSRPDEEGDSRSGQAVKGGRTSKRPHGSSPRVPEQSCSRQDPDRRDSTIPSRREACEQESIPQTHSRDELIRMPFAQPTLSNAVGDRTGSTILAGSLKPIIAPGFQTRIGADIGALPPAGSISTFVAAGFNAGSVPRGATM